MKSNTNKNLSAKSRHFCLLPRRNRRGVSPTYFNLYHYAGNNPVRYIDPDGRNVTNNTKVPITVRTENGYYVVLKPGDEYVGRQDGVLCPDGTTYISEDVKSEAEKRKSSEGMEE